MNESINHLAFFHQHTHKKVEYSKTFVLSEGQVVTISGNSGVSVRDNHTHTHTQINWTVLALINERQDRYEKYILKYGK